MAQTDKINIGGVTKDIIAPKVVVDQTATTVTIEPNCFNVWDTAVSSLTLTLGTSTAIAGKTNEYHLRFTVSGSSFALTFSGSTITFNNTPTWADTKTYEVSILDDLGLVAEFS